jgi:predicted Zn-ribbon and HTH transcriptional regulator
MLKWLKDLDNKTNMWMEARAYKKGLGKGPCVVIRCRKCRSVLFTGEVLKLQCCPKCKSHWFDENPYLSIFELIKVNIRIWMGK